MVDVEEDTHSQDETNQDENLLHKIFCQFDSEGNGTILCSDIQRALQELGEPISQNDAYRMVAQCDPNNTGYVNFEKFKSFVLDKRQAERGTSDEDMLDAFVSLGGDPDGEGSIDANRLIQIIKNDFQMTIDIEALISKTDKDGSGEIDFEEFCEMMRSAKARTTAEEGEEDADFDEFNA
jgi:Ca2+-binding EF-hand superfamily protein